MWNPRRCQRLGRRRFRLFSLRIRPCIAGTSRLTAAPLFASFAPLPVWRRRWYGKVQQSGFRGGDMAAKWLVLPHQFAWANVQSALGQRQSARWQRRSALRQIEVAIGPSSRRPDGGQRSPGAARPPTGSSMSSATEGTLGVRRSGVAQCPRHPAATDRRARGGHLVRPDARVCGPPAKEKTSSACAMPLLSRSRFLLSLAGRISPWSSRRSASRRSPTRSDVAPWRRPSLWLSALWFGARSRKTRRASARGGAQTKGLGALRASLRRTQGPECRPTRRITAW
jgi:hypothetical protein